MKKQLFKSLNSADEKFIDEADPVKVSVSGKRRKTIRIFAIAACLAAVLAINLILFIPFSATPPDVSKYQNSSFFEIIKKLNDLTFEKPAYKNNYEVLSAKLDRFFSENNTYAEGDFYNDAAPADNAERAAELGKYTEITDNQVEGVIEADRIKRSDKYIFYLYHSTLEIFSIDKENTSKLGEYSPLSSAAVSNRNKWEFYLSEDCRYVTMIVPYTDGTNGAFVKIVSIDVSDPTSIKEVKSIVIKGNYISSRLIENRLVLVSEFVINKNDIDFSKEETFLPQIDLGGGMHTFASEDIVIPEEIKNARYTIATVFDTNDMSLSGSKAFLSYTDDIYVNKDRIYLFRVFDAEYTHLPSSGGADYYYGKDNRQTKTEITCLSMKDGSVFLSGKATVEGYIKDQYSLDEYEGILRVVTTTNTFSQDDTYRYTTSESLMRAWGNCNASLFCIDISTWQTVASVEGFAPPHEEVQSVRFDGKTAYVCTSVEMSDPVFFFDLSDINNITYKDTGRIDGYSSSLVNFGDGYLLGIGVSNWNDLKIEMYEEASDSVVSVCSFIKERCSYSRDYKSYYIDRANRLVGLGVCASAKYGGYDASNDGYRYIVLQFDGYELHEIVNVALSGEEALVRGVCIDGYMYMFGNGDFKVVKIFDTAVTE